MNEECGTSWCAAFSFLQSALGNPAHAGPAGEGSEVAEDFEDFVTA